VKGPSCSADGYRAVYLPHVRLDYIDDGTLQCGACMDSYNGLSGYRKRVGSMTLQKNRCISGGCFAQGEERSKSGN